MVDVQPGEQSADRRVALAREWDAVVEQIRAVAGFADFLRAPKLSALAGVGADGPVIVVNVSSRRCDALIVSDGGVEAVALPGLDAGDVHAQTSRYLDAMKDRPVPAGVPFAQAVEQRAAALRTREAQLDATMKWLWDVIVEPVLTALDGPHSFPAGTVRRVWWCPTDVLALLPLHGAGYHDGTGRAVIDRVVSSYTPTLRALAEARRRAPTVGGQQPGLFVGMPDTVGQVQLAEAVTRERAAMSAALSGSVVALEGAAATVDAVAAAMARSSWVHLSCHGQQHVEDPTQAGFLLADGSLTVARLAATRVDGELAYLSACRTATGGISLADESITLAAALSYAGFRHVLGTLWTVRPEISATVAEAVYPALVRSGTLNTSVAATALHHATRSLRDGGTPLADWLPFVHYGP